MTPPHARASTAEVHRRTPTVALELQLWPQPPAGAWPWWHGIHDLAFFTDDVNPDGTFRKVWHERIQHAAASSDSARVRHDNRFGWVLILSYRGPAAKELLRRIGAHAIPGAPLPAEDLQPPVRRDDIEALRALGRHYTPAGDPTYHGEHAPPTCDTCPQPIKGGYRGPDGRHRCGPCADAAGLGRRHWRQPTPQAPLPREQRCLTCGHPAGSPGCRNDPLPHDPDTP